MPPNETTEMQMPSDMNTPTQAPPRVRLDADNVLDRSPADTVPEPGSVVTDKLEAKSQALNDVSPKGRSLRVLGPEMQDSLHTVLERADAIDGATSDTNVHWLIDMAPADTKTGCTMFRSSINGTKKTLAQCEKRKAAYAEATEPCIAAVGRDDDQNETETRKTMEPLSKRPRLDMCLGGDDDELAELEVEDLAPERQLEISRHRAAQSLKSRFQQIIEKYSRDFTDVTDEIDLRTGEIVVSNGHIASLLKGKRGFGL